MTDADEPTPWDRLPHDPQGFFGLPDGFDRRDLRRAYNRLLRRFRPERFPDEFQRIRAAFEALDDRLRYGFDLPFLSPFAPSTSSSGHSPDGDAETRQPIATLVETHGPEAAFAARSVSPQTPQDFVGLAILSDLVPSERSFVAWLLLGLRTCGRDMGILRLLDGWAREPQSDSDLVATIRAVAEQGDPFTLGLATEQAWRQLLQRYPFPAVAALLEEIRRNVGHAHDRNWVPLLIQIVRAAIFVGEEAWLGARIREVEELSLSHGMEIDAELDEFDRLMSYRRSAAEGGGNAEAPIRREIDRTIRSIVGEDAADADRRMLELLLELQGSAGEVLQEFPPGDRQGMAMAETLEHWAFGARDRLDLAMPDEHIAPSAVRTQLRQLERTGRRSGLGWLWTTADLARTLVPIFLAIAIVRTDWGLSSSNGHTAIRWLLATLALVGLAVLWFSLRRLPKLDQWFARTMHRTRWRADWARFFERNPLPVGFVVSAAPHVAPDDLERGAEMVATIAEDPGLWLVALAHRVG